MMTRCRNSRQSLRPCGRDSRARRKVCVCFCVSIFWLQTRAYTRAQDIILAHSPTHPLAHSPMYPYAHTPTHTHTPHNRARFPTTTGAAARRQQQQQQSAPPSHGKKPEKTGPGRSKRAERGEGSEEEEGDSADEENMERERGENEEEVLFSAPDRHGNVRLMAHMPVAGAKDWRASKRKVCGHCSLPSSLSLCVSCGFFVPVSLFVCRWSLRPVEVPNLSLSLY